MFVTSGGGNFLGIIKGNPGVIQADPDPNPTKTRTRTQGRGFSGLGSGFFGSRVNQGYQG